MWGQIVTNDIFAFNLVMEKYKIDASILQDPKRIKVFPESFILYPIEVGSKVKFSKVVSLEKEITSEIASFRMRNGFDVSNFSIRFVFNPFFMMEIDSPPGYYIARPLNYNVQNFQSLIGVQYSPAGRSDIFYNVLQHHQTLIAAISGHGKSFLLNTILSDLYRTPPSLLKIDVLDFKNDLKVNYERTSEFISSEGELGDYIQFLEDEKEKRRRIALENRRIVIIDEAAEIPKDYDERIASIMKLGRSIGINTILATQHPTANQLGKTIARSFTHRIVGRVENATAAKWATGTESSGAESLLRPGSFLFCHGSDVKRFQVFTND